MNIDSTTIDQIVAGVLNQLAADEERPPTAAPHVAAVNREAPPSATSQRPTTINESVITAEVLSQHIDGSATAVVASRAIVTPAALDLARERGVEIVRSEATVESRRNPVNQPTRTESTHNPLLLVVRNTDAVDQLWNSDLSQTWQRELLGCADEAAALATSAICRGETQTVVILAEQTHRAACLSNRNDKVKAAAVRDSGEVRAIRKELRANTWCIDPSGRNWFELRNLLRSITDN